MNTTTPETQAYRKKLLKILSNARQDQMTARNVSARRYAETVERRALAALRHLDSGGSVEGAHRHIQG